MIVLPEIVVTPDYPVIKIREPRDNVDLAKLLPQIMRAQGWGVGTFFHVQFTSHDRTRLLATARFVVSEESESIQTNESNPNQPMTRSVTDRACAQLDDWWTVPVVEAVAEPTPRKTKAA